MSQTETLTSTSPDIQADNRVFTEKGGGPINASFGGTTLLVGNLRQSLILILDTSATAYQLGLPIAGVDDGKEVTVFDTTGHAHTVTTPTSGINGASHIATFDGVSYTSITFRAYQGGWVVTASPNGVVIS